MSEKYTSGRDVFNKIYEIKENDFIEGVRLLSRSSDFSFENKEAILNKNISTTLLSPSGKVFDVDIFDIHEDFIFNVFATIFENKSDIDIYEVADEFNIDIDDLSSSAYEHVTNNLGFITLNTGDGFSDDRCKAVIHKRPTQQQINLLRD